MQKHLKKISIIGSLALLLALFLAFSSFAASSASAASLATWNGQTTGWANVRTGTNTSAQLVTMYAPNTTVTVYATVSGQTVWAGISTWYRVSSLSSSPRFIYGGLVSTISNSSNGGGTPSASGKEIVISISHSWLYAYQNGKQVFNAAVITGRSALPTPTGTFHIFAKLSPTTFTSPWPYGSPYWYPPTHINHALEFLGGGYFLHDTWWHTRYGPGTNNWHYDPVYGWQWGTHGCVGMPDSAASWLYSWAPIGTTVQINP
jgi:lipoprotein-anchoring transpeptidase ErfK/SrfK